MFIPKDQAGISLIELVVFIVVVGVAATGVLSVMNATIRHSADPLLRKQALAVAESLLEEVLARDYADPDGVEPESARSLYDDVADYNGLAMAGIVDMEGGAIAGLGGYSAGVAVAAATLGGVPARRVTVTVAAPGNETVVLVGYRTDTGGP